jgi:hypothetical protein
MMPVSGFVRARSDGDRERALRRPAGLLARDGRLPELAVVAAWRSATADPAFGWAALAIAGVLEVV